MILPIITYASPCLHLSKQSQAKNEVFQKRVLKWVLADYKSPYRVLLDKSELLPLSLFLQTLDLLYLTAYLVIKLLNRPFQGFDARVAVDTPDR